MWKLHRYYLKELAINAGIAFLVVFGIVMVSMIARGLNRALGGDLFEAAMIVVFMSLDAFPHLLPITFLIGVVLTFARAAQDRELIAIRGAGISPATPMVAALLLGAVLAVVGSLSMHYVLPAVHFRKYRIGSEVAKGVIQALQLNTDRIPLKDRGIMTFRERTAQNTYVDCTIWLHESIGRGIGPVVFADRVELQIDGEALHVHLDGWRNALSGMGSERGRTSFSMSVYDLIEQKRRNESDSDLTSDQLLSEVMRGVHHNPIGAVYTLHRRTCFSLLPVLLAPIGFCISILASNRGRVAALVTGLLPLVVFYAGDVFGAKLLRATDQPLFAWLPVVLLILGGTPFCWKVVRR